MKVLLITDGIYPYVTGGMQKHSYYLAKFLTLADVEVVLVHCHDNPDSIDEKGQKEFSDFQLDKVTFKSYPFPSLGKMPGHYVKENKQYSETIYKGLRSQLNEFDLIYCQGFTGWKFIVESKKGTVNIPIISNIHGYEMFQKSPSLKVKFEHLLIRDITKQITLDSDYVFSFGGKITEILKELGVNPKQIIESPIGIESSWVVDQLPNRKGEVRKFVFVGRFERRKGVQELSKALEQINAENRLDFEMHFIGEIPEQQKVVSKNVIYHGKLTEEAEIQKVIRSCDVLVCPSYSEGMPTVIMEAMASGLAIIGADVGAVNQQVDNNGWLIANAKVDTIKQAIESAIQLDDNELDELKSNSLSKVKNSFLWEQVIKHKIKCFETAIENYKAEKVRS